MDPRELFSSRKTSVDDLINLKKDQLVSYLRSRQKLISGSKLVLAKRAYDAHIIELGLTDSVNIDTDVKCSEITEEIPEFKEVLTGWSSQLSSLPKITISDIEQYLIHSSHRTTDTLKMECYRQYIRGLNFYKEKYIHTVMINDISESMVYIRSKCFPSMKQGEYTQWILMTKTAPFSIIRASCTCPAGLGEGCTHISGLLFAIEGHASQNINSDETACTSKPCEWNKPRKRKKNPRPVSNIEFKRIKLNDTVVNNKNQKPKITVSEEKLTAFRNKLCTKLGNTTNAVIFHLLPTFENNTPVEDDLNVGAEETVETTEHIRYESDEYINLNETIKQKNMNKSDFLKKMSDCSTSIVSELECRTRGQADNHLWVQARKGRITASVFHDVLTRKKSTPSKKLVDRIISNDSTNTDKAVHLPALKWGSKMEFIAKKQYKALKKLKFNENIKVLEQGLCIYQKYAYLGASPDGLIQNTSEKYLIEIKCPYKWRFKTVHEACKDADFCCFINENNQIMLKENHRYFTQVQGQMGICGVDKCDFVIYTTKEMQIVTIRFNNIFWESLLKKLTTFYTDCVVPCFNM